MDNNLLFLSTSVIKCIPFIIVHRSNESISNPWLIVICIRVHIGILSFSSFPLDLNRINYSSDEKKMTNLKNRKFILSFEYVGIEIQSLDLVSELHGKNYRNAD